MGSPPRPRIAGTLSPILRPVKVTYDPVRGLNVGLDWESAGPGVVGVASGLLNSRNAFTMEASGHRSRLSTVLTEGGNGFPDIAQDHWQLRANDVLNDIKTHPKSLAIEAASSGSLALVLKAVDDFTTGGVTTVPTFPSAAEPLASALFQAMKHGTTHFFKGQYVFVWTTTVSFGSTFYRNESSRELLFSTSQVIADAGPPFSISAAMGSISEPAAQDGWFWGWRRVPSTRTTQAQNRIEISTEFWLDQWSTYAYDIA